MRISDSSALGSTQREFQGWSYFAQQWTAICAPIQPVLVLAGPGAGKTRCIIGRIAYLLSEHQIPPSKICTITFTNKAAQEIRQRLTQFTTVVQEELNLGTLHALCTEMLRAHSQRIGLPARFGIADENHQKLILSKLGVETRRHRQLLGEFGRHRLIDEPLSERSSEIFARYGRELRSNHLIDFDEILSLAHKLLESAPNVREAYHSRWTHLLVDEFQDLDQTQYAILKLLAGEMRSFFAVGDDDQSIFSWRGADPRVMERFAEDFAIRDPILLNVNCRCSETIFDAARRVLPLAESIFDKPIVALRSGGEPVQVYEFAHEYEEARWLIDDLQRALLEQRDWGRCGVLYRNHFIGQFLEEAFLADGIPCRLARGQSLRDDPLIAVILAALRIVQNPDADLQVQALAELVLSQETLLLLQRQGQGTVIDRLRQLAESREQESKSCWRFVHQVANLQSHHHRAGDLPGLIQSIVEMGLGKSANPLEECSDHLTDPQSDPEVAALAEAIQATRDQGGSIFLPAAGGLEIPVKHLLQRTVQHVPVRYLDHDLPASSSDLVIAIAPLPFIDHPARVVVVPLRRLCIVHIFKTMQWLESQKYQAAFESYVVFDLETTGKDVQVCAIIEIAAVKVRSGQVIDTFHTLVATDQAVPTSATSIHGYTDQHLLGAPKLEAIWPGFREFVGDDLLVAHNGLRYDVPLLQRATQAWNGTDGLHFYDTLLLARSLFPNLTAKLSDLASHFGVETGRSHHALDDCRCLAAVFEHLLEERLRRSRKTALPHLLDAVALGAAIENQPPRNDAEKAILSAARWRELRHHANIVDVYNEESEQRQGKCPPLATLIARIGELGRWSGNKNNPEESNGNFEALDRLRRIAQPLAKLEKHAAIARLLDRLALTTSDDENLQVNRIDLLTFHATKGLEFDHVYLIGVEDQIIPGFTSLKDNLVEEIKESARLLYVAMTRARDRLTITSCKERRGKSSGGRTFLEKAALLPVDRTATVDAKGQ